MDPHGSPSPSAKRPRPVHLSTEPHGSPSPSVERPRPVAISSKKVAVTVSKGAKSDIDYFNQLIQAKEERKRKRKEEVEDSGDPTEERPLPHIVKYHDLLEQLWGWDRLIQLGLNVTLPVYTKYLEEYHRQYVSTKDTGLSAPAGTCLMNEKQLVTELMARVNPEQKTSLLTWRSIILSCLIQKCERLVNHPADCKLSDVPCAALLCIAKEAELMYELLSHEAPIDDDLIIQSTTIRLCALSLMNCTRDNSVSASAVMLGMAKEAGMMCSWMHENKEPIDFYFDPIPMDMFDCDYIRGRTLAFIVNHILTKSSAAKHKTVEEEPAPDHMTVKEGPAPEHMTINKEPARSGPGGDEDNISADEAVITTGGCQYEKGGEKSNQWKDGEKSNKKKVKEEDDFGKMWCLKRLWIPPDGSVKSSAYRSYLDKYYESNAHGFVAAGASKNVQNVTHIGHAVAKFCLEMEEELLSVWNTQVDPSFGDTPLAFNAIVESSLIKEHAFLICDNEAELDLPSAIAFVCITKEAKLICELLKHGAEPSSPFIQLSSVIRLSALGLLKGGLSVTAAAAMMGVANEAKEMYDWMKRENRLLTLSLSESCGLDFSHWIRINALDVMTSILVDSSSPSSKDAGRCNAMTK